MRILAIVILIFGVALAGGAVYFASQRYAEIEAALARQAAEAAPAPAEPRIETKPVVVATRALRYGEALKAEDLKVVSFPEDAVPSAGFSSIEEVLGAAGGSGQRIVLRSIEENEPVLRARVTGFGERATISAQLTPGMRAFTLQIDTVSGVAGFLLPNDRVDIFLTRTGTEGMRADMIMQNVKVIAVDQFSEQESNRARVARTATVEVTPEDAQKLALAQQLGRISLGLRQIDETATLAETHPVDIGDIVATERTGVAPQRPPVCVRKGIDLVCE